MAKKISVNTEIERLQEQIKIRYQTNEISFGSIVAKKRAIYSDLYNYLERVDLVFANNSVYLNTWSEIVQAIETTKKANIKNMEKIKIEADMMSKTVVMHKKNGLEILDKLGECKKEIDQQLKELEDLKVRYIKFKELKNSAAVGLAAGTVVLALGDAALTGGLMLAGGLVTGGYASYRRSRKIKKVHQLLSFTEEMLESVDKQYILSADLDVNMTFVVENINECLDCFATIIRFCSEEPETIINNSIRLDVLSASMGSAVDETKTGMIEIRKQAHSIKSSLNK